MESDSTPSADSTLSNASALSTDSGLVLCHCGKPLHYMSEWVRGLMDELVSKFGPTIKVTVAGRSWLVPRHYIALHGIKGAELAELGFEEVEGAGDSPYRR